MMKLITLITLITLSTTENSPSCLELFWMRLWLCLHHREGFVDRNLGTTLQNGAAPGHLDCRAQRISRENGIPTGHRPDGAITDGSVASDAFGLRCKGIASVYDGTAEAPVP